MNTPSTTDRPSSAARPARSAQATPAAPAAAAAPAAQAARAVRAARTRPATRSVAVPVSRREALELRDLLEANLHALEALHDEHRRMLDASLRSLDGMCGDLRAELRAIGNVRAPWVRALSETRALLFVALRELIVGAHEAELSHRPQQEPEDPPHRLR